MSLRHILDTLYVLRVPFALVSLIFFLFGLALLETASSFTLALRVIFGTLALVSNLVQIVYSIYLTIQLYSPRTPFWRQKNTILRYIDSFLGLILAWGMGSMAFWVIDTTPAHERYFLTQDHHLSKNVWLVAIDFTASATDQVVTNGPLFPPSHVLSRSYYMFLDLFHYLYAYIFFFTGVDFIADRLKNQDHHGAATDEAAVPLRPTMVQAQNTDAYMYPLVPPPPATATILSELKSQQSTIASEVTAAASPPLSSTSTGSTKPYVLRSPVVTAKTATAAATTTVLYPQMTK